MFLTYTNQVNTHRGHPSRTTRHSRNQRWVNSVGREPMVDKNKRYDNVDCVIFKPRRRKKVSFVGRHWRQQYPNNRVYSRSRLLGNMSTWWIVPHPLEGNGQRNIGFAELSTTDVETHVVQVAQG